MIGKFFMVWAEGGNIPVVKHKTEKNAVSEAARLSEKFPGIIFYVLESVKMKYLARN